MARARKRHLQQSLRYFDKNGQRRGLSKHKRTGRPPKGERSSERHKKRKTFKASEPLHVVLRVAKDVMTLRRGRIYQAVRAAMVTMFSREGFRIVHISIQPNHIHLIIEANDRMRLARGMQAFQISAAKHINAALVGDDGKRRRGCVFTDRYHAEVIDSPKRARHTLAYVLNNWRHHGEHRQDFARGLPIDPFSSADSFDGWQHFESTPALREIREVYKSLPVWEPRTWLLYDGWKRHGYVDVREVPGPRPTKTAVAIAE